jgi:hypothetical protein
MRSTTSGARSVSIALAVLALGAAACTAGAPPDTRARPFVAPVTTGQTWATRPLVNDFPSYEASLLHSFSRSRALESRSVGRVTVVDDARRWANTLEARFRGRLYRTVELFVAIPYVNLNEGRPTQIPFGTDDASDLIERRSSVNGLGEVRAGLAKQWTGDGRRPTFHTADVIVKMPTGSGMRDARSELTLGSFATDVLLGTRHRVLFHTASLTLGARAVLRERGENLDSAGRTTLLFPGHETGLDLEYLNDLRPWLTLRGALRGRTSGRLVRDGQVVGGSNRRRTLLDTGVVARLSQRSDLDLSAAIPIGQKNEALGLTYSAGLRWRF